MRMIRFNTFLLCWVLALLHPSLPATSAEIISGQVVAVHDGDTLTLLTRANERVKIRLAQIDAPESDQAFGPESSQSLAGMVLGKTVGVNVETVDANGRFVGTVYSNGLDTSREQVRRGMAWAYRQYLRDPSLLDVEGQARKSRLGLWADANPMAPWAYRHGGKDTLEPFAPSPPQATPTPAPDPTCGGKRTCKEMASCAEAKFYLTRCGLSQLDRDKDGIPCERMCNERP